MALFAGLLALAACAEGEIIDVNAEGYFAAVRPAPLADARTDDRFNC